MFTYIFINQGLIKHFKGNYYYKIYKYIQNKIKCFNNNTCINLFINALISVAKFALPGKIIDILKTVINMVKKFFKCLH